MQNELVRNNNYTDSFPSITKYMFIDATPIAVCHNLREKRHKVFKGLDKKGKSSTGWFFGFKLHFILNTFREIVSMTITGGNVNDRSPVMDMVKGITGKLISDKGYISKKLSADLFEQKVTLITKIKKNIEEYFNGYYRQNNVDAS